MRTPSHGVGLVLSAVLLGALVGLAGPAAGASPRLPPLPHVFGPAPSPSPSASPGPTAKPVPVAAPADRWALIVGVTQYRGNVPDTVGGAADARLVRTVLLDNGWRADRIRLLTDEQATGRAIAAGLDWLQANSSTRTFSLFHYSGHGRQAGGHEYLWPVDNAYLVDTDVSGVLRGIRGTAWTNISACHAGGMDEGLASSRHLFTSSSTRDQKSYEDTRTGHSVWTGMLFDEALRSGKADDADRDGAVSVGEAYDYAAPRAGAYTSKQRPYGQQTPQRRGGTGTLRLDAPRL